MAKVISKHQFFMPMERIPTGTAQQRKICSTRQGIRTYPSKSYVDAKKILTRALAKHKPNMWNLYAGPVLLDVEYRYETTDKKKIDKFKTTRPDGDNLLKVLKDCMTGMFYVDDSQVCVEAISRYWVAKGHGGIMVRISEIESEVF